MEVEIAWHKRDGFYRVFDEGFAWKEGRSSLQAFKSLNSVLVKCD